MKTIEIKAGPELDEAINKSIGLNGVVNPCVAFIPSVDWSDAMFAAEACGLFDEHFLTWCHEDNRDDGHGKWVIQTGYDADWTVTRQLTGPLAICAAILDMKARE